MIAYHIDPSRRVVTTRVSGDLSGAGLAEYLARIVRDPKFDPTYDALIVAMDASAVPSPNTAALLAPLVRSWSTRRSGARWAFVLPHKDVRQAAELALNQVRLTTVTARCFLSEAAALAWLEATRPPGAVPRNPVV
ncbi:MAG TPA: hypothetical protein VHE61_23970 [Opitutaceae bacterium]|nr:hypothetical protein [Opitutaceae bacterium]